MKAKKCSECEYVGVLFRSTPPLCANCARKYQKKPKQVSDKRAEKNKQYSLLRKDFLAKHTECQAKLVGCTGESSEVHHKFSGMNRDTYFLSVDTWLAICNFCHRTIHDTLSAKQAIALGLKSVE